MSDDQKCKTYSCLDAKDKNIVDLAVVVLKAEQLVEANDIKPGLACEELDRTRDQFAKNIEQTRKLGEAFPFPVEVGEALVSSTLGELGCLSPKPVENKAPNAPATGPIK